ADRFDAAMFGIAPREADAMDPQQRWLLEVAWHALEHAGIAPDGLAGSPTGVFVGLSPTGDYASLKGWQLDRTVIDAYDSTGNAPSIAAGRLAYVLGLTGPALVVDTACSSSLVALHLAAASLRRGESTLAIVAGVNAILGPDTTIAYCKTRMLSPTGRCRTFDAAADGYVRGEGAGAIVLKRLADARRDGDPVHAVVRGSAVNQDGKTNGLTAPSSAAQQRVIAAALADAGVTAAAIGYLEAHGTGTRLGDPIELAAAGAVLGAGRTAEHPVLIGSVKTNIGHLEAAAGLAGLVKVVLAMRHGLVPPHLHLSAINPEIDRGAFAFGVPTRLTPWPVIGGRKLAGISSFGFSGTNAHVIVEAGAPASAAGPTAPAGVVLAVSARTADGLRALVERHAAALAALPAGPGAADVLASYARTAGDGRAHLACRLAVVGETADDLVAALRAAPVPARGVRAGAPPRVRLALVGAPGAGSGRALFDGEPVFRAALERADALARPALGGSVIEALYRDAARLAEPAYATAAQQALHGALVAVC
ncbi:MAG TPA: polyketide synthase, partial [Kofleriaceae bacterium]